ncbi:MAG: aldehyde ferredoxin oxidoreductase N-terminal domain-containing protein [Dehalococcoidales bacterium]|nr:aldehyde ferredoxin oxidoreductase N-terminal domain-containing protein [Dehalococcoidales bacterium]
MANFGWTGKILWVNLTDRKIKTVNTAEYEPENYLGGVGLNTKMFWEMGSPNVEAFSPDNPLMISIGPLTGINGPFNRAEVSSIAPQSYPKELYSFSGFGGKFPSELKFAGYDSIVILGKASKPVYLVINDDKVEIKDAKTLWGLDTFETQKTILSTYPKASSLVIGPAGENLSRIAIMLNETASAAGQGGYGAVMGSKNLKAIVVRGSGTQKVANAEALLSIIEGRRAAGEWLRGAAQSWGRYPLCGEPVYTNMKNNYLKRIAGCHGCPYQCMGFYEMPGIGGGGQMCVEGWYGYFSRGSSEGYWDGNIMSQKLGINNYELLAIMNMIGQIGRSKRSQMGLTMIPSFDHVGETELGGAEVHHQFLTELLGGIADGTSPFSQGLARAAETLGATGAYSAMSPNRGYYQHHIECVGSALHWATDSRDPWSSCHDYQTGFGPYANIASHFGVPGGDWRGTTKTNMYDQTEKETIWVQHNQQLKNSLPICDYSSAPNTYYHPPSMDIQIFEAGVLSAVTGVDYSVDRMWQAAERIWNLSRAVGVLREDRTRADDALSPAWFQRVIGGSESLSAPLNKVEFEKMLDRYYEVRGWNKETARPTRDKLTSLGLGYVADKLESVGKIG